MNIKFPPILENVLAVCSFDPEFEIDLKSVVILRETVQPIRETSVGPFWWTWPDQHRDTSVWWKNPHNLQVRALFILSSSTLMI